MRKMAIRFTLNIADLGKEKDDGTSAWLPYDLVRSMRNTKAVKNEVKGPTALEHSLKQEVEDLKLVCSSVEQQLKDNKD